MGSAILGIAAVTGESPFAVANRFWKYGESIQPNKQMQQIYQKRYQRYTALRAIYMDKEEMR